MEGIEEKGRIEVGSEKGRLEKREEEGGKVNHEWDIDG